MLDVPQLKMARGGYHTPQIYKERRSSGSAPRPKTPRPISHDDPARQPSLFHQGAHPQKVNLTSDPISEDFDFEQFGDMQQRPHLSEYESKACPHSEVNPSTVHSASETSLLSLGFLNGRKAFFTLIWLDLIYMLFISGMMFSYIFFAHFQDWAKIMVIFMTCYLLAFSVVLALCHLRQHQDKLWLPLLMIELYDVPLFYFNLQTADSILKPGTGEGSARYVFNLYAQLIIIIIIGFFQNSLILFNTVEGLKNKKRLLVLVCGILSYFQLVIITRVDFPSSISTPIKIAFIIFIWSCIIFMNSVFAFIIHYFQNIQFTVLMLELEENRKFQYMFNSIEDAVVLLEDKKPKFVNSLATLLLGSDSRSDPGSSAVEQPLFYTFQKQEGLGSDSPQSIIELLEQDPRALSETIFTTSREIASCTRMDQVQLIVEESAEATLFYSIKLIRISRALSGANHRLKKGEEVMVQIQDISLRVYSQYVRVERQYLALMNSTVSHEMRNPLNALVSQTAFQSGNLNKLQSYISELDSPEREEAEELLNNAKRSLRIALSSTKLLRFNVEDILALPQLKQGKFTKNLRNVSVASCVAEVVEMMQFQAEEKRIKVDVALNEAPEELLFDEQRFQQVLLNYLSNALKFTDVGGRIQIALNLVSKKDVFRRWQEKVEAIWASKLAFKDDASSESISAAVSQSEQSQLSKVSKQLREFTNEQTEKLKEILSAASTPKLVLTVVDTGIGIKVEEQTRLFKLFGTIKRTRAVNTRGVGLGLSISKMICEEFGGGVAIQSKPGMGSAFVASFEIRKKPKPQNSPERRLSIRVAQARISQDEAIRKTQELIRERGIDHSDNSRILVVDDEAYNCEVLRIMLQQLGIPNLDSRLTVCINGKQALKAVRSQEEPFRVVLTDLSMPVMDGYQLISRLRAHYESKNQAQPIITALTGHTEEEFINLAFQKGADAVYSKPVSLNQVRKVLLQCGIHPSN